MWWMHTRGAAVLRPVLSSSAVKTGMSVAGINTLCLCSNLNAYA